MARLDNAQLSMMSIYQGFSVGKPNRADLSAKKSRSTFDCPICRYNSSICAWASGGVELLLPPRSNSSLAPPLQLPFPTMNHCEMNTVLTGNLGDSFLAFDRFKCKLGFELGNARVYACFDS